MNEYHKYGTLIARLMREEITDEESLELDEWILAREENMKLFECLINDYKVKWAKQWFRDAGVSYRGIKWKKTEGWYRSEEKATRDFYIVMAITVLTIVGFYYLSKLLPI